MSRRDKLLERIRANPHRVSFRDLATVLEWHGFELRRTRGSHHLFKRGQNSITVVFRKPYVHPRAVKEALALIDALNDEF
jgi:predicted RNA binding protein YcfA (HicA-like mRNA interferase family)